MWQDDVWCIAPKTPIALNFKAGGNVSRYLNELEGMRISRGFNLSTIQEGAKKINPDVYLGFTSNATFMAPALWRTGCHVLNNISGLGSAFITGGPTLVFVRTLYKLALGSYKVFFQNENDSDLFLNRGLVELSQSEVLQLRRES